MHPSAEEVLTVLEHSAALRRYTMHRNKAAPRGKFLRKPIPTGLETSGVATVQLERVAA
jgi:hypothetical protein